MIAALTLLYFGFNFLKGIDFFSSNKVYYTFFNNVDGLTESNTVKLNGYGVGRVSGIEIQQEKGRVLVELSISSDIQVPDSSMAVLNGELLGGRFIQLVLVPSKKMLEAGDTIKSDVAKGLVETLAENAKPVAANVQTTLTKVNTVLDLLAVSTQRIDTLLQGLSHTPKLINQTIGNVDQNLTGVTAEIKKTTTELNETLAKLKPIMTNVDTFTDSLKQLELNGTLTKVQTSLTKLNETLALMSNGKNTVSKLLTEDSLYVNLNKTLMSFDSLVVHFNQAPRDFLAPLGRSRKKIESLQEKGKN